MLQFEVQTELCTQCGLCAGDCPAGIISLKIGHPEIAEEREKYCLQCEHCMAICPTGAISILGVHPEELRPLPERFPAPEAVEALIRSRRSVRSFEDVNVDPELLTHLLEVSWQAPTGKNDRGVQFTVVDDRLKMVELREKVMNGIDRLAGQNALPESLRYFGALARRWKEKRSDMIFRGAPHLLIASAPSSCTSPYEDCLIALTTFDLFAQAHGIGTTWVAYAKWAINMLLPELKQELGIPADHVFGFAMIFGKPAIHYARTVLHRNPLIHRVS